MNSRQHPPPRGDPDLPHPQQPPRGGRASSLSQDVYTPSVEPTPGAVVGPSAKDDRSIWICAVLTVLVCCLWTRAEVLNARAGYVLPVDPPTGNGKWRIALGETEEEWKRFNKPLDETGKARPYTQAELDRMRSEVANTSALNALNRYVRSILILVYLVPPVVIVWSLVIATGPVPIRQRLAAVVLALIALACAVLVQYRLQHLELIG